MYVYTVYMYSRCTWLYQQYVYSRTDCWYACPSGPKRAMMWWDPEKHSGKAMCSLVTLSPKVSTRTVNNNMKWLSFGCHLTLGPSKAFILSIIASNCKKKKKKENRHLLHISSTHRFLVRGSIDPSRFRQSYWRCPVRTPFEYCPKLVRGLERGNAKKAPLKTTPTQPKWHKAIPTFPPSWINHLSWSRQFEPPIQSWDPKLHVTRWGLI